MAEKLIGEEGLLRELVLSFEEGDQWIIGRDPDSAQLLLEDPAVSRKQAECKRSPQGISIQNLSPNNPILVNNEPIADEHLLRQGDTVKMGDTQFRFYSEEQAKLFDTEVITENEVTPNVTMGEQEPNEDTIFGDEEKADLAQVNFDFLDSGRWLLKVVNGPNTGAEFPMQSGNTYIVGTDPNSCDIIFYDTSVSRQHLQVSIGEDDRIVIEDLKSRNGTRIEGEIIKEPRQLEPNTFVSIGTTSFVVYDREGAMQTIISPMLPSIVKALQKDEGAVPPSGPQAAAPTAPPRHPARTSGAMIVIGILTGVFVLLGISLSTLFMQQPVTIEQQVDIDKTLADILSFYPAIKYSFNKPTGHLLLVGHVLTIGDKNQLMYNLQGLKFIKQIDDTGVVIDEFVWHEANQLLSQNPSWKGVLVYSNTPGRFILSGYLENHEQAEQVWDYLSRNFSYLDLLENKIIVEEDVAAYANNLLRNKGFTAVNVRMDKGELVLNGNIPAGQKEDFTNVLKEFESIPGVRTIRNMTIESAKGESFVNISDRYSVSGTSRVDGGKLVVVINGRILSEGDVLDGMVITKIQPTGVYLEKDGITYKVDIRR